MKKIILSALLLSSYLSYTVPVKFSDAQIINTRLTNAGFQNFAETTSVANHLVGIGQEKNALQISCIICKALIRYNEEHPESYDFEFDWNAFSNIIKICEIILVDHPESLKEVEELIDELD